MPGFALEAPLSGDDVPHFEARLIAPPRRQAALVRRDGEFDRLSRQGQQSFAGGQFPNNDVAFAPVADEEKPVVAGMEEAAIDLQADVSGCDVDSILTIRRTAEQ